MRAIRDLLRRIGLYRNIRLSYNVRVRARDRSGFVVQEHKGKNIFLDVGRDWLLHLIAYDGIPAPGSAPPDTFHERRMGFIGVGIGGREQSKQAQAIALYAANPGYYGATVPSFLFDDTNPAVTGLEDPIVWDSTPKWLKPISSVVFASGPVDWIRFTTIFDTTDINDAHAGSPDVYVSEAAIYPVDISGGLIVEPNKAYAIAQASAYEAFPEVLKADFLQLEVQWTFRL